MKKRILSILLTLCMVLCIVPTSVFAEGETTEIVAAKQELVDALADDTALRSVAVQSIGPNEAEVELDLYEKMSAQVSVIKLISDIELSGSLRVDYAVTIDLNGHVLKMGDIGDGSVIKIESTGDLTVIDSAPNAPHKFKVNGTDSWVLDETGGTKTVNGGVIYGGKSEKGGGVCIEPGGEFTMTGGSIVGCTATDPGHNAYGGGVYVAGTFKMTGGNIVGCTVTATTMWDSARGGGVYVTGTFTMSGGSIIGCTAVGQNAIAWGGAIRSEGTTILSDTVEIRDCHATGSSVDGGGISAGGLLNISGDVQISGCTADGSSDAMTIGYSESTISGGTFDGTVKNYGKITGGTLKKEVTNIDVGTITGGVFYGGITNQYGGKIDGLTVTYRVNKADYAVQVLQSGEKATKPTNPVTTAGYDFSGWFTSEGATYDFSAAVTENLTLTGWLYAPVTNETELKAALADDTVDVIRLTDDVDIGSSLTILRKLTLDMNGHVLKMTGSGSVIILDDNNGTTTGDLTLIDSDPTAEHKFKVNGAEPWVLDDNGTEIVKGGVITGGTGTRIFSSISSTSTEGGGVIIGDGSFTMDGGNIVGCTAYYGGGLYINYSGAFTMNGGSIVGCSSTDSTYSGVFVFGPMTWGSTGAVITLTGGLIKNNGKYDIRAFNTTTIYANGGEVYGQVDVGVASKITSLAGHTGVTAFRGLTMINGAYGSVSHIDWGIYYGELFLVDGGKDITTGLIVTYMTDGVEYAKQVLPSGTLAMHPDDPTTLGYIFGGWNKADGTAWNYATDTVTESITLYADLTPKTYTVTFDTAGGPDIATKTMTATYGKSLANMPVPRREGYVFVGWYDAMVGGKCYGNSDGNGTDVYDKDENITLYAQWAEAPSREVRFNKCGGTMTNPVEVWHKLNTPIARPSDPTKLGYTFTGWYTDLTYTQLWNFDDWVTGEMMLYAGWKVNQYTITIKPENGEADTIITQDFGTAVTAPNLTKTGYTFMGWDKTFPTTMPAENITITAQWKINQYTITFDTNGGSKIASVTQDYGTAITAPDAPTRKGYKFTGWDKVIPETMPAENMTITAQWKDTEKPTGEISIGTNQWKTILNNITFGMFFKDTQTVKITAADNSGDDVKIEYLLSDKELTKAEIDGMAFTAYTAPFSIDPDNEYIIYVRLTDKAGNTDYICSDASCLTEQAP